jgi:hypothetical protein
MLNSETASRSYSLTNSKRQALEAELRRVKAWCVGALPGLPIKSDGRRFVHECTYTQLLTS